jgi:hypothetical protein
MTTNSQPHNGSAVNADNSEVRAAIGVSTLDAASAEGHSPPSSEGAAIGAAAPSSSDAVVSQPVGCVRAVEGEDDPAPPVTGTALEAEDRALLRAENARLKRLADALHREQVRNRDWTANTVGQNFPWVQRAARDGGLPHHGWSEAKLNRQVEDEFAELRRKQLARKQGQDKEG